MSAPTLLSTIDSPADLRGLSRAELKQVADELRDHVLTSVSATGGHLSSNLGTVELTVALHYVFDTPNDRIVSDVGHQTSPHKILTGRRDRMGSLRQLGGISGFPRRDESEYDTFGTAHSSTSISAALGLPYWHDVLVPRLRAGRRLLVISHGNTLRGLVMHLADLSAAAMERVEIPSGVPLVVRFGPDLSVTGQEWLAMSAPRRAGMYEARLYALRVLGPQAVVVAAVRKSGRGAPPTGPSPDPAPARRA